MARFVTRKRSQSRNSLDAPILERICAIKSDHPLWGYRRIWAYMRDRDNQVVAKNSVYRLIKEHALLVSKNQRLKAIQHDRNQELDFLINIGEQI